MLALKQRPRAKAWPGQPLVQEETGENQLEETQSSAASAQVKDKHAWRVCNRFPTEAMDCVLESAASPPGAQPKVLAGACLRLCEVFQQRCAFLLRTRPDAVSSAARALDSFVWCCITWKQGSRTIVSHLTLLPCASLSSSSAESPAGSLCPWTTWGR